MMNADAQLEDILRANEEDHLYGQIMSLGHPPMVFAWKQVEGFIRAIETARARVENSGAEPLPDDPLGLPTVVTVKKFKEAVLEYLKPEPTNSTLGTSCILCSLPESGTVGFKLRFLDNEPWIQRVIAIGEPNMLPIAMVYMPRGLRAGALDHVTPQVTPQLRPTLWG
ncbi:Superfamily II DNA/RNA helicase, SNF2 family [Phytophthora palmivora]|uniref:Superfamily II DNA/RNA helicase, SNF2 family n=1 Tax=Phytophthora palmivora TaxID=4796 RepID=A0A2P4YVV3_9STRA|nr:Superfamily II DNA/RNA helicase, SNF2 family [Phytophthora palmivora]